ncbi:MAG: chemotaxis protein CheD [Anaerovoracaceae bacterium]|jgi:chemotaxis protein CheD
MNQTLTVGISDYRVSRDPNILVTYALGSCVGICLYDNWLKIGGLAHIMLPDSTQFQQQEINRMKYADTAIVDVVKEMRMLGCDLRNITAKIAGGAKMFQVQPGSQLGSIGDRNVDSVKKVLGDLGIPIVAEDTRKNYGRTVYFDLSTGIMKVHSLGRSIIEL